MAGKSEGGAMETLKSHFCVGCGANAKLTRKERGDHGGFYLTFTCLRCGTKEILKSVGEPVFEQNLTELRPR